MYRNLISANISLTMQPVYINALNQISTLGPRRIFKLLFPFNNRAEDTWRASHSELIKSGLPKHILEKFISERNHIDPESEWLKLKKLSINVLCHPKISSEPLLSNLYPPLLAQIPNPPPILYQKGSLHPELPIRLAVVGARKISSYGQQIIADIIYQLALQKIVIVSGLAIGTDSQAHQMALKAHCPTIAVLANGLDQIYPITNYDLAADILADDGAILSEFPLGTPAWRQNFPQRNRLISGLAQATLVIEATLKSGSLITASHALEQNRDVFAVPGNIYQSNYQGTNNLIKQGAKPITNISDILDGLNLHNSNQCVTTTKVTPASPIQQKIYSELLNEPVFIDVLIKKIGLSPAEINSTITLMEIKGLIKNNGGGQYVAL